MEFNKIDNLLGRTEKWIEVHDQSNNYYNTSKPIRFKTPMLRSDLCDYSDAYIWVQGIATQVDANHNNNYNRRLTLKNNAPFISCISKINGELVENAEDLDVVRPMYNLLEYSKNYQKASRSLFNYYRDEPESVVKGGINISIMDSDSFDYKSETIEPFVQNLNGRALSIAIPLKHIGNFWRNLDIPLINYEITLN